MVKQLLLLLVILVNVQFAIGQDPSNKTYVLRKDIAIGSFGLGGASYLGGYFYGKSLSLTTKDYVNLKVSSLWSVDRGTRHNWSTSAADLSDVFAYGGIALFGASAVVLGHQKNEAFPVAFMYAEALVLNAGVTELVKNVVHRPRPFLYGNSISLEEKKAFKIDGWKSFYSGHTSNSFCTAAFVTKVFADLFPASKWRIPVGVGMISWASYTGYLRFKAGKHFPTDIIAGALAGSLIGWGIPQWHKKSQRDVAFLPYFDRWGARGVSLVLHF